MGAALLALLLSAPDVRAATARNLLFLPVTLGDSQRSFVVDTGASSTIVNARIAREAGLALGSVAFSRGAGADRCPLAAVEVGARAGKTALSPVYAADLGALEDFSGVRIDGIAGASLFAKAPVALDVSSRTVALLDELVPAAGDVPIPVVEGCCVIEAEILAGAVKARGRFLLDTGAPGLEVVIAAPFARRHRLERAREAATGIPGLCAPSTMVPVDGRVRIRVGLLPSRVVTAFLSVDREGVLADGTLDGAIGGELLRRLGTIVIDRLHRRIVVRPR